MAMLGLTLAFSLLALAAANQQALHLLDPASCVDKRAECPNWEIYCRSNGVVKDDCPATCRQCRQTEEDKVKEVALKEHLLENAFREATLAPQERICGDSVLEGEKCESWTRPDPSLCHTNKFIREKCRGTCRLCGDIPRQYDLRNLPSELRPISWLLGRWRSEAGGKAIFPTIPNFTYGEQLDFSIADRPPAGSRALNYSAFAWGINDKKELHSEFGFLAVKDFTDQVALNTVMNNGFVTVEEGKVGCWGDNDRDYRSCPSNPSIVFTLEDIGRITFSRDLPVHGAPICGIGSSPGKAGFQLKRTWKLLGHDRLEATLEMETLTHPPQEHTRIVYDKIFP